MNDYLNELRDSARAVVSGANLPAQEEKTWALISELGWLLAAVPEEFDGLGLGVQGACVLHSELGRGLSQTPFLPAVMALDALCQSKISDKASWIGRIAAGDYVATSLAEPALNFDEIATDKATLSGLVSVVPSADKAGHVLAWTGDGDCVALVSVEQPGVELIERPTWDITRRLFDLHFSKVALEEQLVLARGSAAQKLVARLQTLRDFSIAADSLGGSSALLDLTVEHLQTRQQFGRPLALFQALKHRCADLKTQLAGAEAMLQSSLAQVGDLTADPHAQLQSKKAKYLACSVFSKVAEEALQLHGGIGMASEHPCHLFLKRAMLNEHLGTTGEDCETAIADNFLSTTS